MADYEEIGDPEFEEDSETQDEEIEDFDGEPEEDDSPDLKALRHERQTGEGLPIEDEEDEEEGLEEETEEEEEETPEEPPKKGNVHAALRVAQRSLVQAERTNQILATRFNQLLEMVQNGQFAGGQTPQKADAEPEEPMPSFDEDPMGNISGRLGQVEKMFKSFMENVGKSEQINTTTNALREIDNATAVYAETIGRDTYNDAIQHLAQVRVQEEILNNPGLTEPEAVQIVAQKVINDKIRWARAGVNPGEQWVKQARTLGWRPTSKGKAPVEKNANAREAVARSREKNRKGTTISRAPGSAASKSLTVDDILKYPERDWDTLMRKSAKAMGKSPRDLKFSDIVPPMR